MGNPVYKTRNKLRFTRAADAITKAAHVGWATNPRVANRARARGYTKEDVPLRDTGGCSSSPPPPPHLTIA